MALSNVQTVGRWAHGAVVLGLCFLAGPAQAEAQDRLYSQGLTGSLPGCRWVSILGEGQIGPEYRTYLSMTNPLGVTQALEVQIFDDGSMSPPFNNWVALPGKSSYAVLPNRGAVLEAFRAISMTVRWELGGEAHLTTWRVPEVAPVTPSDWLTWIRAWRLQGYGPVTEKVICQ